VISYASPAFIELHINPREKSKSHIGVSLFHAKNKREYIKRTSRIAVCTQDNFLLFSNSRSNIQSDDGYIGIAETCLHVYMFTCKIKLCTDCDPASFLYKRILKTQIGCSD